MDNVGDVESARHWISQLREFLDITYDKQSSKTLSEVISEFPPKVQSALQFLPTSRLSSQPFYGLLKGFEMDLAFTGGRFPIEDLDTLHAYAERVAGTVAESCIELADYHGSSRSTGIQREQLLHAGKQMGIALQLVNIARDIKVDALIGRVYVPTTWLDEAGMSPQDMLHDPNRPEATVLRQRLLDLAMEHYTEARPMIEVLPKESRGPMRVAVESYMEIGRVLREGGYHVKAGRATVPKLRRLRVAWKALAE